METSNLHALDRLVQHQQEVGGVQYLDGELSQQTNKAVKRDYQRTSKRPDSIMTGIISQREEREIFEKMTSKEIHSYKSNENRREEIQQVGVCLVSYRASTSVAKLRETRE